MAAFFVASTVHDVFYTSVATASSVAAFFVGTHALFLLQMPFIMSRLDRSDMVIHQFDPPIGAAAQERKGWA